MEERIQGNLLVWRANYLIVLSVIMSLSIITSPFTLAMLLLCAGAFVLLLAWRGPLVVMGRTLSNQDKMVVAGGCT